MSITCLLGLFTITGIIEILGCWLVLQAQSGRWSWWWNGPAAALSLGLFAWLLTLPNLASGRLYAAYGGIYVLISLLWLVAVDRVRPTTWDAIGVALCVMGTLAICLQPRT